MTEGVAHPLFQKYDQHQYPKRVFNTWCGTECSGVVCGIFLGSLSGGRGGKGEGRGEGRGMGALDMGEREGGSPGALVSFPSSSDKDVSHQIN